MNLWELLLWILGLGVIVWLAYQIEVLPAAFKNIIKWVCIAVALWLVLNFFGVVSLLKHTTI